MAYTAEIYFLSLGVRNPRSITERDKEKNSKELGWRIPGDKQARMSREGRHLRDDKKSCPILGLSFLLWMSRRFVSSGPKPLESSCSPEAPQGLLQQGAEQGASKGCD